MSWRTPTDFHRYIYHYTKWEVLVAHILPTGMLRLGPFRGTSDPYEFSHWYMTSKGVLDGTPIDRSHKATDELWGLKDRSNMVAFAGDDAPGWENNLYRRGFSRPPMWAHYAERFGGVCLVFEKATLREGIQTEFSDSSDRIYDAPITYELPRRTDEAYTISMNRVAEIGVEAFILGHVDRFENELFFRKQADWAYEREYRIVVVSKNPGDLFIDIKSSLRGIVLGHRCPLPVTVGNSFAGYDFEVASLKFDFGEMQLR
jgi:hypothetical protein